MIRFACFLASLFIVLFSSCEKDDFFDECIGVNCPTHDNSDNNGNNTIGGWEDEEKKDTTVTKGDDNNKDDTNKGGGFDISVKEWNDTEVKDITF